MNILELNGLVRSFPGTLAVDRVSLSLRAGEIHGLVGGNGAGKSTLIHMIAGLITPDTGTIFSNGVRMDVWDTNSAERAGIVTVHQEGEFFPTLSVAENTAHASGFPRTRGGLIDWATLQAQCQALLQGCPEQAHPQRLASSLSNSARQLIRLAAALHQKPQLLILDEPTAALSHHESEWLFQKIRQLKSDGGTVLYISHRLEEVLENCDRVSVLRDGRLIATTPAADWTTAALITAMAASSSDETTNMTTSDATQTGHSALLPADETQFTEGPTPPGRNSAEAAIVVTWPNSHRPEGVDKLPVAHGQIVAIYGLIGSGRSSFAEKIMQLRERDGLSISINNQELTGDTPRRMLREGISLLPEDRLTQSVFATHTIRANVVLSSLYQTGVCGLINTAAERRASHRVIHDFNVRCSGTEQTMQTLSGGNQQKLLLGRCLLGEPRLLILDEPTRGVDAAARLDLYQAIRDTASCGAAVLMLTSDLDEALQQADSVAVFRNGQLQQIFSAAPQQRSAVTAAAFGTNRESDQAAPLQHPDSTDTAKSSATRTETTPSAADTSGRTPVGLNQRFLNRSEFILAVAVCGLILQLKTSASGFQLFSVLHAAAPWCVLSLAAMVVIIAGGIDISIGSILAVAAAAAANVLQQPLPAAISLPLALVTAIVTGACCGLINGWTAVRFRIHPIVVTLGTLTIFRGLVILMLGRNAIIGITPELHFLSLHEASGFRTGIAVAAGVVIAAAVWLRHTQTGRQLYAVGSSANAAFQCGLPVRRLRILSFVISGALAGLTGIMQLSSSMQMQGTLGNGWELTAIAAAVIGGVSIDGGRGTVIGVILGCILLRLSGTALVHWGIPDHHLQLFTGAMLFLTVAVGGSRRGGEHRHG